MHHPTIDPKKAARAKLMVSETDRFVMRNAEGEFLHFSGKGFTTKRSYAWWGTAQQVAALRRSPYYATLKVEPRNNATATTSH
jgi:hypothetical protein